ncbi:hypothetical protein QN224_32890 [Sinorhizobium sp. 8-89]|uniref:hypothetical protein n=1 Tax=Sinorhizobium sp. 7-81 TaxID=3049087 RepID=UPI0024C25A1B|nr:hypothetical protein [Sinorhizobium sp. 7-81]MDK1390104.1 hypothetical protein [Sinorhizobium sp. 7-81]
MKTPWKFLAQLVSARRPAKAQESLGKCDTDRNALESEAEHTSVLPPDDPGTRDHQADVPVDQGSTASDRATSAPGAMHAFGRSIRADQTPAPDEVHHPGVETVALMPESQTNPKSQRKPRTKRRERVKRAPAQLFAQSPVGTNQAQSLQSSSSADPFFDEVVVLDEEIKKLRSRLAQKLHLQNVQLKKMLERFEIS